jgi:endonuclease YncB( thermonuclease family)
MSRAYRLLQAALVVGALGSTPVHGRDFDGRVVGIQDGDTVTVLDAARQQHRIRIAGIDAPEKSQAFGTSAKENLARLAFGKQADVRCNKRDRYGREVCSVHVGALDVGLEQVRGGYAWWFREYAREQSPDDRRTYAAAESEARAARRGLWRDPGPVAPWDWRRQARAADQAGARSAGRT